MHRLPGLGTVIGVQMASTRSHCCAVLATMAVIRAAWVGVVAGFVATSANSCRWAGVSDHAGEAGADSAAQGDALRTASPTVRAAAGATAAVIRKSLRDTAVTIVPESLSDRTAPSDGPVAIVRSPPDQPQSTATRQHELTVCTGAGPGVDRAHGGGGVRHENNSRPAYYRSQSWMSNSH